MSTFLKIVLILGPSVLPIMSTRVDAQACCAGATAGAPARIGREDSYLAGLQLRAGQVLGNFGADGRFSPQSNDAQEWSFEQNVFAAVKVAERGQIALTLPFAQTFRSTSGVSSFGGGLADIRVAMRYDCTLSAEDRSHKPTWIQALPGIAVLAHAAFPTGRTADASSLSMAADSTGTGLFEVSGGLGLEHLSNPLLLTVSALYTVRNGRSLNGLSSRLSPRWTFSGTAAYAFENHSALALNINAYFEGNAEVEGAEVANSNRRMTFFGLSYLMPLFGTEHWKWHNSVSINPPIGQLGKNQPGLWIVSTTFLYSWH